MLKPLKKQQQGLTMISWIVVGVFLMFQIVIAMNVIPVYLTDSSVKSILEELPNDAKAKKASARELKTMIVKRLNINSIYTVKAEHIKIRKTREGMTATIEYEPRGALIGNLEYIVSFKHEAVINTLK